MGWLLQDLLDVDHLSPTFSTEFEEVRPLLFTLKPRSTPRPPCLRCLHFPFFVGGKLLLISAVLFILIVINAEVTRCKGRAVAAIDNCISKEIVEWERLGELWLGFRDPRGLVEALDVAGERGGHSESVFTVGALVGHALVFDLDVGLEASWVREGLAAASFFLRAAEGELALVDGLDVVDEVDAVIVRLPAVGAPEAPCRPHAHVAGAGGAVVAEEAAGGEGLLAVFLRLLRTTALALILSRSPPVISQMPQRTK